MNNIFFMEIYFIFEVNFKYCEEIFQNTNEKLAQKLTQVEQVRKICCLWTQVFSSKTCQRLDTLADTCVFIRLKPQFQFYSYFYFVRASENLKKFKEICFIAKTESNQFLIRILEEKRFWWSRHQNPKRKNVLSLSKISNYSWLGPVNAN